MSRRCHFFSRDQSPCPGIPGRGIGTCMSCECFLPDYEKIKEKQMSKDKAMEMPTKEQILAAAKLCPEWKEGLKTLFSKAFEVDGEWKKEPVSEISVCYSLGVVYLRNKDGNTIGHLKSLETHEDISSFIETKLEFNSSGTVKNIFTRRKR